MSPPTHEVRDTHTKPRQMHVPWEDWRDLKHAAVAAGAGRALTPRRLDRAARVREYIAWYLHRDGAALPERPPVSAWVSEARADTEVPRNKDAPRQIRMGAEWIDFGHATAAAGTDRTKVVQQFIAWDLRRKGATLPNRPPLSAWIGEAPLQDDRHDLQYAAKAIGMEPDELIREFVAWFLRRPAVTLPKRPTVEAWLSEARDAAQARGDE